MSNNVIKALLPDGHAPSVLRKEMQDMIKVATKDLGDAKLPAGGAVGDALVRDRSGSVRWENVREGRNGRDGQDGRGVSRIEPAAGGRAVNVVMSDGSTTEVPVNVTSNWTAEQQAKAQGYWQVVSDEPPTETEMFGVPVVWVKGGSIQAPNPVYPMTPSVDYARRVITIPNQVGVRFTIDGVDAAPGDHTVPGTALRTVSIEAHAASTRYVMPSAFLWPRTFGDITDRPLVASVSFTGRAAGEELVPVRPESEWDAYGNYKDRDGELWDNSLGGNRVVRWRQSGPGIDRFPNNTTVYRRPWTTTGHGTITDARGKGSQEDAMLFDVGATNVSLEFDVAAVNAETGFVLEFGVPRGVQNQPGTPVNINFAPASSRINDKAEGGTWGPNIIAGAPTGTWRVDFLDGVATITSPQGIRAIQDSSPLQPAKYGHWVKFYAVKAGALEISAFRVYHNINER